jgi:hypothetical protein
MLKSLKIFRSRPGGVLAAPAPDGASPSGLSGPFLEGGSQARRAGWGSFTTVRVLRGAGRPTWMGAGDPGREPRSPRNPR